MGPEWQESEGGVADWHTAGAVGDETAQKDAGGTEQSSQEQRRQKDACDANQPDGLTAAQRPPGQSMQRRHHQHDVEEGPLQRVFGDLKQRPAEQ